MRKISAVLLGLLLVLPAPGCSSTGFPNWLAPGPAQYQQGVAQQFDPYPETAVAPEVTGSRPREFQRPTPEPARARWIKWGWPPSFGK